MRYRSESSPFHLYTFQTYRSQMVDQLSRLNWFRGNILS